MSQLLTAHEFQKHSGSVLQSLFLVQKSFHCFEFTAEPGAYLVTPILALLVSVLFMLHLHLHADHMQSC